MKRIAFAAPVAIVLAVVTASPSTAAITLGQLPPTTPTPVCSPDDRVQPSVTSGNSYAVPASGTITSWSTLSGTPGLGDASMQLKIFRPTGIANTFTIVGQDGPRAITANALNAFPLATPIQVQAGDLVGLHSTSGDPNCGFVVAGDSYLDTVANVDTPLGGSVTMDDDTQNRRLNVTAEFEPANRTTFGAIVNDTTQGTATVPVAVPNAGFLSASGAGGSVVVSPPTFTAPGTATLTVSAIGAQLTELNTKGTTSVTVSAFFAPTGGATSTNSTTVALSKQLPAAKKCKKKKKKGKKAGAAAKKCKKKKKKKK